MQTSTLQDLRLVDKHYDLTCRESFFNFLKDADISPHQRLSPRAQGQAHLGMLVPVSRTICCIVAGRDLGLSI